MAEYVSHKKYFVVLDHVRAGELLKMGFVLLRVEDSKKDKGKKVYLFSNSRSIVQQFNRLLERDRA